MKLALLFLGCVVALLPAATGCGAPASQAATDAENTSDLKAAAVSLRIPILDFDGKPLSKHNAQFKAAGLGTFPDSVEIQGDSKGKLLPGADKAFSDASTLVDQGAEKLHIDLAMREAGEPFGYETNDPTTTICYRGNPLLVIDLIDSLTDGVFSDQLNVHGWRYRQKKVLDPNLTAEDEASFPAIWKEWRGQGEAILTITASSDDGNEMNVGLIAKCR